MATPKSVPYKFSGTALHIPIVCGRNVTWPGSFSSKTGQKIARTFCTNG